MKYLMRPLLILLGMIGMVSVAGAAVYNMYFNNVEQGDNSTATPSVTVHKTEEGTKVTKTSGDGTVASPVVENPAPAPAPVAAPVAAEATSVAAAPRAVDSGLKWRFSLNGGRSYNSGGWASSGKSIALNLGYFPLPYLGFNVWGGHTFLHTGDRWAEGGAEIEVDPVKLNLFGFTDSVEVGVMAGLSNLGRSPDNYVSLYAGARVALNFASRWNINVTGRGNYGFYTVDAGLGYRF
ncbi:MAG: hypothetical protein JST16_05890 [Bdellovibrionales bacterium]|nr:hypothetical protein [Bdellovibrionales bacterium]